MNEKPLLSTQERNILMRGLYMVLMAFAAQLAGTLLFIVAVIQFATALLAGAPNAHLLAFGRSLAQYEKQLVLFLTFASEEVPFPFSAWPGSD